MTPKKYLWPKILHPKNTPSSPVGLCVESLPLGPPPQYLALILQNDAKIAWFKPMFCWKNW